MTDHDHSPFDEGSDVHALSGAYAVDALDELERARFEAHMRGCADCRAEVVELQETAALLGIAEQTPPPDHVRDAVLAGIEQVRPLPPEVPHAAAPRRGVHTLFSSRGLLVAASLVAVLALAGSILVRAVTGDDPQQLTAADRVLAAADATRVSQEFPSGATATIVRSRSEGRAVIVTDSMDPAPEGKVYALWFQGPEGDMVPAGVMPKRPDAVVLLEGDATDATGVGITVEPEGGSPEPSSAPIALFELPG